MCLPNHHKYVKGLILVFGFLLYFIPNNVNTQFIFLLMEGNLFYQDLLARKKKISFFGSNGGRLFDKEDFPTRLRNTFL